MMIGTSMYMSFAILGLLLLLQEAVCSSADSSNESNDSNNRNDDEKIHNDMIAWIRSKKGGYVSSKIQIQRHPIGGYMGVFAIEDIEPKERLFTVPKECYIEVFDKAENMDIDNMEDSYLAYHHNLCKLTHKLITEMKLDTKSKYSPYIAYLKTQKFGQLPANWSKPGKDLLRKIAFQNSPIVDWIDWYFKDGNIGENNSNCISKNDKFEEHMAEMTVQRCYDTALIPLWDMVNHDNGRINTENDSMYDPEGLKLRSSQHIKAGEEIFATYDKCVDCYDIYKYWGTPEILKDFGFLERYPHRWAFFEQNIWFEVDRIDRSSDDDNDNTKEDNLQVIFYDERSNKGDEDYDYDDEIYFKYGIPNKEQIDFLQKEVDRLIKVKFTLLLDKNHQGDIPDYEWQTINNFHQAIVTDFSLAIAKATKENNEKSIELDSSKNDENASEL